MAVDCGGRCLKIALVESFAGRVRLLRQEFLDLSDDGLQARNQVGTALANIVAEFGDCPIALAVPQSQSLAQIIDLPKAGGSGVQREIEQETMKLAGLSDSQVSYDYARLKPFGKYANPFWISLGREEDFSATLKKYGISRQTVCEVTSSANARLAALLKIQPGIERTLVADIGLRSTELTLVLAGQGVLAASIATGGERFTEALAAHQGLPFDAAEALKCSEDISKEDMESSSMREALEEWRTEVERLLAEWLEDHAELGLSLASFQIILTGGGASLPGMPGLLSTENGPRYVYWPAGSGATANVTGHTAVAYGAALQAFGQNPQPASLLPDALRQAWKSQASLHRFQSISVLAALVVTLLLVFGTVQKLRSAHQKQKLLTEAETALGIADKTQRLARTLELNFERVRPVLERQQNSFETLAAFSAVESIATNRPLWFVLFGDDVSYATAGPPPSASFVGPLTPGPSSNNASTLRRGFVAELCIDQEGDAMRKQLSDTVADLKKNALFSNVDSLPADQRRPVVDPRITIPERHFALALELPDHPFTARSSKTNDRPARGVSISDSRAVVMPEIRGMDSRSFRTNAIP